LEFIYPVVCGHEQGFVYVSVVGKMTRDLRNDVGSLDIAQLKVGASSHELSKLASVGASRHEYCSSHLRSSRNLCKMSTDEFRL